MINAVKFGAVQVQAGSTPTEARLYVTGDDRNKVSGVPTYNNADVWVLSTQNGKLMIEKDEFDPSTQASKPYPTEVKPEELSKVLMLSLSAKDGPGAIGSVDNSLKPVLREALSGENKTNQARRAELQAAQERFDAQDAIVTMFRPLVAWLNLN